jgi:DNA-binding response OmpR family regulator
LSRRILVIVPPHPDAAPALADAFQRVAPFLTTDLSSADDAPWGALLERRYEAAVCWANRPEDLAVVARLRKGSPATPILVVSSSADDGYRDLALNAGASFVLPDSNSLAKVVGQIERTVEAAAGAIEVLHGPPASDRASRRRPTDRSVRLSPLPLLVSDHSTEATKLEEAFARAGMFAPLPILRSSEEAIAYLSGKAPYENRERHPLPSLILLDFHGPRGAGLDLLGWIRQQDRLRHLPVIVLSAALDLEDIKGAYGLQANSYLIKPGNFDELVEMVKAIKLYWSSLNISPET